ncbi:MAG TPA: cation:proton antiporter, partial [Thermomicrobiales bacterium]|nr:cation:proton antiporter [Thermomicrobiales bacterium]
EIGIVLLLFAIGIQFSLGDLLHAGKTAAIGSTLQVILTIAVGFAVGIAAGWEPLESLFFGAVLSNSSSTVLSKVLGERGEMDTGHGKLALAWSTVQDLSTIILIVVLSALATGSDALLLDLGIEVGKAALFLVLLVPVGLRVLPWFFERIAELRSREVFVLTVGVVALGLAYGATFFGLSLALGAFVVGVVVSESDLSHQILGEVLPLRDIFAGLFFVSVGMLVDPGFVVRNVPLVLMTLAVIVLFKGALSATLAWLLGTPTRTAVLTGAVLAQAAEFSFLLAQVGRDLGAISSTVFSLLLAAAAVSIVLLPAIHEASLPLADALHGRRSSFQPDTVEHVAIPDTERLRGHAVICGFGRVGAVIGRVLRNRFTFVAIEEDVRIVSTLRSRGIPVIRGNAAVPAILEQAHLERARELVIALADPVVTRQIVDQARHLNPRIRIIVRTHSEVERQWLLRRNVDVVVLGEWELALEMASHALRGFGVSAVETDVIIQRLRGQEDLESIRNDVTLPAPSRVGELIEPEPAPERTPAADEPITRRLHDAKGFRSESDVEEEHTSIRPAHDDGTSPSRPTDSMVEQLSPEKQAAEIPASRER